jgi:hypothetical protein
MPQLVLPQLQLVLFKKLPPAYVINYVKSQKYLDSNHKKLMGCLPIFLGQPFECNPISFDQLAYATALILFYEYQCKGNIKVLLFLFYFTVS